RDDLEHDEPFLMALIKYLEIIGEAAAKTTDDTQRANPAIPWRQIVGMRNRLIHVYFDVNTHLVWRTVDEDLPPLIAEVGRILAMNG
ncbi:MAG: HepT-like ribonuclease domain-containing protein, partial [Phycisphaeraceae bacterium]